MTCISGLLGVDFPAVYMCSFCQSLDPCVSETSYPFLRSLCQKWKYGYENGLFSWYSNNSVTVKHEGHFQLILTLLLGVMRNYKLSGASDLQRRKHSIIVLLHKNSVTCSGCLLNWNKFLCIYFVHVVTINWQSSNCILQWCKYYSKLQALTLSSQASGDLALLTR